MDQIRRIFATIQKQLSTLTVTQKLLIASMCVVLVMSLFLVSQYAAAPVTVELLPGGSPEDQQKATAFLEERGIAYTVNSAGRLSVTPDRKYVALAAMAKAQALPGDKKILFATLAQQQNMWMSNAQIHQNFNLALQNEIANVIRNFPGIMDANVVISAPEASGIGRSYRKPVAQVTVFPKTGTPIDQGTVNALADLVSGSVAGLDMRDVAIIDGTNRRSFRAASPDDFSATTYLEQAAKVEQRVQEKLTEHLRFIGDVIVSVNAIVDAASRKTEMKEYLDKGRGTVAIPQEETTSSTTNSSTSKGAEPGLGSNITADINRGGGNGTNSSQESTTVKSDVRVGEKRTLQQDARGKPTKINVTISVPRDYVVQVVKQRKGGGGAVGGGASAAAEPTEDEIKQAWEGQGGVKALLEETVGPLIETDASVGAAGGAVQLATGTVRAFMIPIAMSTMPGLSGGVGGHSGGGSTGTGGGFGGFLETGIVKPILLGGLALLSIGMMLMMVKKAGKSPVLPTAEELVGVPPALQPGSDVVGEADETETAMMGIEIDDNSLKTTKMLEEVGELVKANPQQAAQVFNRWLQTEE
jgi:flagellar M-ring protein FliF